MQRISARSDPIFWVFDQGKNQREIIISSDPEVRNPNLVGYLAGKPCPADYAGQSANWSSARGKFWSLEPHLLSETPASAMPNALLSPAKRGSIMNTSQSVRTWSV